LIDARDRARVLAAWPALAGLEQPRIERFMLATWIARFREGQDVMRIGDKVGAVPLVLSGRIRVSKARESGRIITIYHFGPGECCVLAANAVMGDRTFPASAQIEEAAEVILMPGALFNDWLATISTWRSTRRARWFGKGAEQP
jgi:CRP/FNR family transcriptional regulator